MSRVRLVRGPNPRGGWHNNSYDIPFVSPEQYIKYKLKVIKDFGFEPTEEELAHLRSMKTEYDIDLVARDIIKNHI